MGKAAAAGIVIALIAGTAIGYYVLPMVFPTRQTYFSDVEPAQYMLTVTATDIPGLMVNVTTQTGDSLELSFTCLVLMSIVSGSGTFAAIFVFAIDGVQVGAANDYMLHDTQAGTGVWSYAIAYRYIVTGLDPGVHIFTVQASGGGSGIAASACEMNALSGQIL